MEKKNKIITKNVKKNAQSNKTDSCKKNKNKLKIMQNYYKNGKRPKK